jgi:hypothetical protein
LAKKDNSLSRRIYTWLFGKPNMDNKYEINNTNIDCLDLVVEAFISIFKKSPEENNLNPTMPIKIL